MQCKKCGNERVIFYNGMCQTCYRKGTKKYKHYKIKENVEIKSDRDKFIIKCFLSRVSKKDIIKYFKMTQRNLDIIIAKYCDKCDKDGITK